MSSLAFVSIVTLPETVAPFAGLKMETIGSVSELAEIVTVADC